MEPGTGEFDQETLAELYGERIVYDKKTGKPTTSDVSEKHAKPIPVEGGLFEEEVIDSGDKFGACLPWLGALVEPTSHPPVVYDAPKENYALEYVYGYRTYDCRQNLYFTSTGKVVFNVAALGVILDPATNTQKFFGSGTIGAGMKPISDQHDDDIVCLSISPDRKLVATGQVGPKPALYIWNAETGKLAYPKSKYRITAKNTRGISSCSWSADGKYVAFVDKSDKRVVYVINAENGTLVYSDNSGAQQIMDIAWSKAPGDLRFAICGVKHISFWDIQNKTHKLGTGHNAASFSCVTFDNKGVCYAGGINGQVFVFKGNAVAATVQCHKGIIHTMNCIEGQIMTGGADRNLCIFDNNMKKLATHTLPSVPRALDKKGAEILIGMRNGTIALLKDGKITSELLNSHHDGEVWGLEVLETGEVLTSCDDNKLMKWDSKERKCKGTFTINPKAGTKIKYGASSMTAFPDNQCSRAICYNPTTKEVAAATNNGEVHIRDLAKLGAAKKVLKAAERWIEFMTYSPNGKYLAVGTHDSTIVIYETAGYTSKGALKAHKSSITAIDWSKDSKFIRSNCEAYELLFFNIESMKQEPSGATMTKDLEWATQNTKIGWSVTGVFPKGVDGTHVNGVCMSENGKLIATGDDWGQVNIYHNPCREGCKAKSFLGHSEHVLRVKFGSHDQYLFSVGGQDKALMQWKKQ